MDQKQCLTAATEALSPYLWCYSPAVPLNLHALPPAEPAHDLIVQLHGLPGDSQQKEHGPVQRKTQPVVYWALCIGWAAKHWGTRRHLAAAGLAEMPRLAVKHGGGVGAVSPTCRARQKPAATLTKSS